MWTRRRVGNFAFFSCVVLLLPFNACWVPGAAPVTLLALPFAVVCCLVQEITDFFNDAVTKALGKPPPMGGTYVINVYINHERRFAFVEFGSIPLTTACMQFGACVCGRVLPCYAKIVAS